MGVWGQGLQVPRPIKANQAPLEREPGGPKAEPPDPLALLALLEGNLRCVGAVDSTVQGSTASRYKGERV